MPEKEQKLSQRLRLLFPETIKVLKSGIAYSGTFSERT
jgi:hypothetical protein